MLENYKKKSGNCVQFKEDKFRGTVLHTTLCICMQKHLWKVNALGNLKKSEFRDDKNGGKKKS